jgi:NAD(P)-dependent dehydrogenase (short-subunit alcohol dehydrogenase family)
MGPRHRAEMKARMEIRLEGEVALVTGGAQGNGRALALGLAGSGSAVAVCDVNKAGAEATAQDIRAGGGNATAFGLDVTDADQCSRTARQIREAIGPVSILINNAGIVRRGFVTDPGFRNDWRDTFAVNVNGSMHMVTACLDDLTATRGKIVNLGSIMSFVSAANSAAYSSTKGAIKQFTKALAIELAPRGIRVNAIAPGIIATPMTETTRANPEAIGKFMEHTPMARVGQPEELVGPVLFLVSKLASYVTGVMLPVDGGYLAK